ncbi:hypothetical protein [Sphingomonas yabuuchiae]|uniref:Ribosomal protein L4 n=1 Tax=Sphingomonas yabuuchiae TaxID=172044 RepID=A0ABR6KEA6_9SPHN|nr:hypothetical protein [Sphingomonas yabuuchiae]MBB4611464.1 ribosomal protein L4 [Sphingomonas yabuuchiae]
MSSSDAATRASAYARASIGTQRRHRPALRSYRRNGWPDRRSGRMPVRRSVGGGDRYHEARRPVRRHG